MNILFKIIGFILAVLTPFASLIMTDPTVHFDKEIVEAREKVGGFMKGICHTDNNPQLMRQANIEWLREDIPFPYNPDGTISDYYINWKKLMQEHADNGIKLFAITPYPDAYINYGLDPRDEANHEKIKEIALFLFNDLKDIAGAFQITNEMGVDRFTLPLTLEEAAVFIGIQLEALAPVKGDILVGYNLCAQGMLTLPFLMKPWEDYCDYVGIDIYLGSFENVLKNIDQHDIALKYVRCVTRKPVILCEFGYIALGEPKTQAEKIEILESYGFSSESEAAADIDTFISRLPDRLREEFEVNYSELSSQEKASMIFDGEYANHIYRELPEGYGLYGYDHTPEGQAKFYGDIIPKIEKLDFVIGAFVYNWRDSGICYVCGQEDCPVETKWGLLDYNGEPKPAFYAIKKAFGDID